MKLGIDVDKQVAQATAPLLARLDTMQTVLVEIRDLLREREEGK